MKAERILNDICFLCHIQFFENRFIWYLLLIETQAGSFLQIFKKMPTQ